MSDDFRIGRLKRWGKNHIISGRITVCGQLVIQGTTLPVIRPELCVQCKDGAGPSVADKAKEVINEALDS